MSSANCRAKSHVQVRTSERNPIFRCPSLRCPPLVGRERTTLNPKARKSVPVFWAAFSPVRQGLFPVVRDFLCVIPTGQVLYYRNLGLYYGLASGALPLYSDPCLGVRGGCVACHLGPPDKSVLWRTVPVLEDSILPALAPLLSQPNVEGLVICGHCLADQEQDELPMGPDDFCGAWLYDQARECSHLQDWLDRLMWNLTPDENALLHLVMLSKMVIVGVVLRGNTIRGNTTRNSEENGTLRGSLRGPLKNL